MLHFLCDGDVARTSKVIQREKAKADAGLRVWVPCSPVPVLDPDLVWKHYPLWQACQGIKECDQIASLGLP